MRAVITSSARMSSFNLRQFLRVVRGSALYDLAVTAPLQCWPMRADAEGSARAAEHSACRNRAFGAAAE